MTELKEDRTIEEKPEIEQSAVGSSVEKESLDEDLARRLLQSGMAAGVIINSAADESGVDSLDNSEDHPDDILSRLSEDQRAIVSTYPNFTPTQLLSLAADYIRDIKDGKHDEVKSAFESDEEKVRIFFALSIYFEKKGYAEIGGRYEYPSDSDLDGDRGAFVLYSYLLDGVFPDEEIKLQGKLATGEHAPSDGDTQAEFETPFLPETKKNPLEAKEDGSEEDSPIVVEGKSKGIGFEDASDHESGGDAEPSEGRVGGETVAFSKEAESEEAGSEEDPDESEQLEVVEGDGALVPAYAETSSEIGFFAGRESVEKNEYENAVDRSIDQPLVALPELVGTFSSKLDEISIEMESTVTTLVKADRLRHREYEAGYSKAQGEGENSLSEFVESANEELDMAKVGALRALAQDGLKVIAEFRSFEAVFSQHFPEEWEKVKSNFVTFFENIEAVEEKFTSIVELDDSFSLYLIDNHNRIVETENFYRETYVSGVLEQMPTFFEEVRDAFGDFGEKVKEKTDLGWWKRRGLNKSFKRALDSAARFGTRAKKIGEKVNPYLQTILREAAKEAGKEIGKNAGRYLWLKLAALLGIASVGGGPVVYHNVPAVKQYVDKKVGWNKKSRSVKTLKAVLPGIGSKNVDSGVPSSVDAGTTSIPDAGTVGAPDVVSQTPMARLNQIRAVIENAVGSSISDRALNHFYTLIKGDSDHSPLDTDNPHEAQVSNFSDLIQKMDVNEIASIAKRVKSVK